MPSYANIDGYLCMDMRNCLVIKGWKVSLPSEHINFEFQISIAMCEFKG